MILRGGKPRVFLRGGLRPALLFLVVTAAAWAAPAPSIRWLVQDGTAVTVVADALPAAVLADFERKASDPERAGIFGVFAEQAHQNEVPPMVGTWQRDGVTLRFTPQFPLARGVRYRAELRLAGTAPVVSHFQLPADPTPPSTVVRQIFPSGAELPENQLKFYIHFSAPMTRGAAHQHVNVRDARGGIIELPFLELDEELWDNAMTRLTLLIDPGRIKRGVKPLEDIGPVFEAGKSFQLTVAPGWVDAAGRPLREGAVKEYRIVAADRTPPDPARWKIRAPAAGKAGVLTVEFDEPMDQALALRLIHVTSQATGRPVAGDTELGAAERLWKFLPEQPWVRGRYALNVANTIEDLAGNNIGKSFDVELAEGGRRIEKQIVSVSFEVK